MGAPNILCGAPRESTESDTYNLGVVLFLKASQEVRVTVTLNVTVLSRGTPTHASTLGCVALLKGRESEGKGRKRGKVEGWKDEGDKWS